MIRAADDFEGGNVEVLSADPARDFIEIRPRLDDHNQNRIWLYCKMSGYAPGAEITVRIRTWETRLEDRLPRRIGFLNNYICHGNGWEWFAPIEAADSRTGEWKEFRFVPSGEECFLATGYPYLYSHLTAFIDSVRDRPEVRVSKLAYSEKNNPVPLLTIAQPNRSADVSEAIWFIGRQHAFDSPASFFLQGVIEGLLEGDEPARRLLDRFEFCIVPIMDVDNVIAGQSGKNQRPVDFNRSWSGLNTWNAVTAVETMIARQCRARPGRAFFDCHSPFPLEQLGWYYIPQHPPGSSHRRTLRMLFDDFSRRMSLPVVENAASCTEPPPASASGKACVALARHFSLCCTIETAWHQLSPPLPYPPGQLLAQGRGFADSLGTSLLDSRIGGGPDHPA